MEPISTALTGLALARSGIEFIKTNMNSVQDAAHIGQQLANVFQGFDQYNKTRYEPKLGFNDIAKEKIEYELLREQMASLKLELNLRFGSGFYEGIVAERQKRIKDKEELERRERQKKRHRAEEIQTILFNTIIVSAVVACLVGAWLWMMLV